MSSVSFGSVSASSITPIFEPYVAASSIENLAQASSSTVFPIREVASGEEKIAALATGIVLSKIPQKLFSKNSFDLSLLQLLVSWIRETSTPENEPAIELFIEGLKEVNNTPKDVFEKHLATFVSDKSVKCLIGLSPSLLHCSVRSIFRVGLPHAEPKLLILLNQLWDSMQARTHSLNRGWDTLGIRGNQTLQEAIESFFVSIASVGGVSDRFQSKSDNFKFLMSSYLDEESIADKFSAIETDYPSKVMGVVHLLLALSQKPILKFLDASVLPDSCHAKPLARAEKSVKETLKALFTYFKMMIGEKCFEITAEFLNSAVTDAVADYNLFMQIGQKKTKQESEERLAKILQSNSYANKLLGALPRYNKISQNRFQTLSRLIAKNPEDFTIKSCSRHLDWFMKSLGEVKVEVKKISALHPGDQITGLVQAISFWRANMSCLIQLFEKLDPIHEVRAESSTDYLLDFEIDSSRENSEVEPIVELETPEVEASDSSSIPEATLVLKKAASIPSEEVSALRHLLENPRKPINGAISHAIYSTVSLEKRQVFDHLLLATQGVELFCDLFALGRCDLLGVCLQSYLQDCHVAIESQMGGSKDSHSLSSGAKDLHLEAEDVAFLKTHDLSILWARYLAHFSGKANAAAPVKWLQKLMKNPTPESAQQVLHSLIGSYKGLLHFLGVENPLITRLLDQIKQLPLVESKGPFKPTDLSARIRETAQAQVFVRSTEEGDPIEHLEEVSNYLDWMKQATEIQSLFPSSKWNFFLFRVELNMDKLFKHLFAADCLLCDYGSTNSHHLKTYIDALKEDRKLTQSQVTVLKSINLGISHHYMDLLSSAHTDVLRPMLSESLFALSTPEGFVLPVRKKSKNFLKEDLQKAFELFVQFVPETLDRLKKQEIRMKEKALSISLR